MPKPSRKKQRKNRERNPSRSSHQSRHNAPCAFFRQQVGKGYHPTGRGLFLSISRSGYEQREGGKLGVVFSLRVKVSGLLPRNKHSGRQSRPHSTKKSQHRQKGVVKSMVLRFRRCKAKTAVNTRGVQELGGECDEF